MVDNLSRELFSNSVGGTFVLSGDGCNFDPFERVSRQRQIVDNDL